MDLAQLRGFMLAGPRDRTQAEQVLALAELYEITTRQIERGSSLYALAADPAEIMRVVGPLLRRPIKNVVLVRHDDPGPACAELNLPAPTDVTPAALWNLLFQACHDSEGHSIDQPLIERSFRFLTDHRNGFSVPPDSHGLVLSTSTYWKAASFFFNCLLRRARNIGQGNRNFPSGGLEQILFYYCRHLFPFLIGSGLFGWQGLLTRLQPLVQLLPATPLLGIVGEQAVALDLSSD